MRSFFYLSLLVVALLLVGTATVGRPPSGGWTQWGGPNQNFVSASEGLADSWPEQGPRKLWTRELGEGYSAILVDGGRLYTMYRDGDQEAVVALDAKTGKTVWPKEILFSRIEMRCDEMMSQGFIEETEELVGQGIRGNLSASQAIGYRQCLEFLDSPRSNEDWEHFVWEFKKASRRYAKRQFTWFRREPLFHWVDLDSYGYQKALEMADPDMDKADLFREAFKTFVRVQAGKRLAALGGAMPDMQDISRCYPPQG